MTVTKQFVLPFTIRSESRKEPFSKEAENATIFALSELERKSGRLTIKQEKISYILKIGYPLWLIIRDDFTYVFDGLNKTSYNWMYYETNQAEFKLEEIEHTFRIREKYADFLDNYQEKFEHTHSSKELTCEGLIADSSLLDELDIYCKEVTEVYGQPTGTLLPVLQETQAIERVDQIETLQITFKEKTEKLKQLLKLVYSTTEMYVEGFNFESKAISEETEAKIKAQKEIINPKIERITQVYKKQIEHLEKSIDKEKRPLEKQKNTIKKNVKKTEINIEHYSKQVKIQTKKGNKHSEDNLKEKLKKEKQKYDELQKHHKKIEKQLEKIKEQKEKENLRLKLEFDERVQIERQPIVTLEIFRNNKQEFFKQESLRLEKLTQLVLEDLNQIVGEREKYLVNMKMLGHHNDFELKNNAIVYVPFYIVAYSSVDSCSKRYFVFPPSYADSLDFSVRLRGVLGRAKIKDLLKERFKSISCFGEKMLLEISSNANFGTQIETLAQKDNILYMETQLREGLVLLKEEGWFSESDYQTIYSAIQHVGHIF